MRPLLVLLVLVALTAPVLAQSAGIDPRTQTSRYDLTYGVWGKIVDADGNAASKYPVTVTVESPDGPVTTSTTVVTSCFGEFDVYWALYNVSARWTVKVVTGGQVRTQGVDVLHRRSDFGVQLDRTLPAPDASDPNCRGAWAFSPHRATFVGQLLRQAPPYRGPMDNELVARPVEGVLVTLKWVDTEGRSHFPQHPLYTNEEGAYKYAFTNEVGGEPIGGYVLGWFADDPSQVTNVTLGDPVRYHVISRPAARALNPPVASTPGLDVLALVGVAALVALAAVKRR